MYKWIIGLGVIACFTATSAIAQTGAVTEVRMYITGATQGKFNGENADADLQKKGAIKIPSVDHEIVSPRDAASGLPTGKRQHKPLTIIKEWGAATPQLYKAMTTGEILTEVSIELWQQGVLVATTKLTGARVVGVAASWKIEEGTNARGPRQTISFTYQKIEWTYVAGGVTAIDDWRQ
ncbi:MAG: type VI secretion system tube protein Hcp [Ignavibacteria bacterium]|nr:type VI secretion system tube protein Hcp [Ignavibacteria bacterium]